MGRKTLWGIAAVAALGLAIYSVTGFPTVDGGVAATIGVADRYQAPQISKADVVLGDTGLQMFMQTETWDRLVKNPELRKLLQDPTVRATLAQSKDTQSLRDPAVTQAIQGDARAALSAALLDRGFAAALQDARFATALEQLGATTSCPTWMCGSNSPLIDGAVIR